MLTKTQIVPIISAVALMAQAIFHKEITPEIQDAISTIVSNAFFLGSVIYGIMKKHDTQA